MHYDMNHISHNICIASYPRSGNTFIRNILMDVFGLFSWNNFHRYRFLRDTVNHPGVRLKDRFFLNDRMFSPEELRPLLAFQIIKTHDLPADSRDFLSTKPFVLYIIRDGRDAVVSEAHHRRNIIEPGSSFTGNLREAIEAAGGSHFGGWSANIRAWSARADLILHFEQLIKEPERCIRKLTSMISLPEPDFSKIPTFESQQGGNSVFITNMKEETYSDEFPRLFFRKGEVGGWKEEMPGEMVDLFMEHHGRMLRHLGYDRKIPEGLKYAL